MPDPDADHIYSPRRRLEARFAVVRACTNLADTAGFNNACLLLGITAWNLEHWILRDETLRPPLDQPSETPTPGGQ